MKIFISWSGEPSKNIAKILKDWIPAVIQAAKPYYTEDDIAKGTRWGTEISNELEEARIGLLCLTPDNLEASWLMFEAGALAKKLNESKVCPILFGIEPSEIKGPLVQFQAARFEKTEIKKVMEMINSELGDIGLTKEVLDEVFEMWWPKLENKIHFVLSNKKEHIKVTKRSDRDLLEEILALIRVQSKTTQPTKQPQKVRRDFFFDYYDDEVRDFSSTVENISYSEDPNNKDWIDKDFISNINYFEGAWFGRWNGGSAGKNWQEGSVALKVIGEKFYFLINDGNIPYLIVSHREGKNRLVGRYYKLDGAPDSTPWVGQIINDNQINGRWEHGRWDFRRIIE